MLLSLWPSAGGRSGSGGGEGGGGSSGRMFKDAVVAAVVAEIRHDTLVEIRRDADYLMRLWSNIREATLQAVAPSLIYEEGNLVKRAIRDLYDKEMYSQERMAHLFSVIGGALARRIQAVLGAMDLWRGAFVDVRTAWGIAISVSASRTAFVNGLERRASSSLNTLRLLNVAVALAVCNACGEDFCATQRPGRGHAVRCAGGRVVVAPRVRARLCANEALGDGAVSVQPAPRGGKSPTSFGDGGAVADGV